MTARARRSFFIPASDQRRKTQTITRTPGFGERSGADTSGVRPPFSPACAGPHKPGDDKARRAASAWRRLLRGPTNHVADDVIGLDRAAALDIAQHRGAERRALVGHSAAHGRHRLLARLCAVGIGDRSAFVEQLQGDGTAFRGLVRIADADRMRQVKPAMELSCTHFDHMSRTISVLIRLSTGALPNAAFKASQRADTAPDRSPKTMPFSIEPSWWISPSGVSVAATKHNPPSTCSRRTARRARQDAPSH